MNEVKLDRKKRYTRMVLQDSLIELMREKPINKITIKELCERADINRTTFYAHYSDQYDLLRKIEAETLSWAKEMISGFKHKTDKQEALQLLEEIFHYFVQNSNYLQVLMSEQGDLEFQKQLFTLIYQHSGINPYAEPDGTMDTKESYFIFIVNGSVGLIQHWLKYGHNKSAREMAEIIYTMAFQYVLD
ncbi:MULTISPECIES: TetR/AcrR family transcriptional regulator [Paenibacillus]|uniref:AcrR family transcriptional regulator n=2 Tax=Paenibacillus TaxID=44249 RepID=A0A920CND6_9BACL|nr:MULTISPECIES: TetR/AcrR family transcriptional regulator [Paenibacillus]GIO36509.1 AcrR family transcriptional regulator [Paenibacillus antibioticophila]GIO43092.1 AcrR family transcriptional regulator [Paenibacillus apis]